MCVIDFLRDGFLNHKGVTKLNHLCQASTQFQIIQIPKGSIHFTLAIFQMFVLKNDLLLANKASNSLI